MKRRGSVIVLAAAVAVGLILLGRLLGIGDMSEISNRAGHGEHEERNSRSEEQGNGSSQVGVQRDRLRQMEPEQGRAGTQRNADVVDHNQHVQEDHAPLIQPAGQAQSRFQAEPPANADREQGSDFSFVGQPFPVSESILTACEPPQNSILLRRCGIMRKLLDTMTEEPREEPWASAAEHAIRTLVELEPGTEFPRSVTYTIRALECRKSVCFLETASIIESFRTKLSDFERTNALRSEYAIESVESDELGTKVYVELRPFCTKASCVTQWSW